jgi:hypothetical protein
MALRLREKVSRPRDCRPEVDEFELAGLTKLVNLVRPPGRESPIHLGAAITPLTLPANVVTRVITS